MVIMGQTRSERIYYVLSNCEAFHIGYEENHKEEAASTIFSAGKKAKFLQEKKGVAKDAHTQL